MLSTTKQRNVFFVILGNSDYCLMLIKLWSYLYSGSLALWLPTATRGKTWLIWYCSLVDNSYKITDTVYTHKASTSITKLWPFIRGLVEVMCVAEVEAQLSTYRHSPHEVRGYFFTADLSLPGQKKRNTKVSKWVEVFFTKPFKSSHVVSCFLGLDNVREGGPAASSPVSFVSAEGEGEVGCYFLKVLQRNVTILVLVVIFHYGLQGATEQSDIQLHLSRSSWLVLL